MKKGEVLVALKIERSGVKWAGGKLTAMTPAPDQILPVDFVSAKGQSLGWTSEGVQQKTAGFLDPKPLQMAHQSSATARFAWKSPLVLTIGKGLLSVSAAWGQKFPAVSMTIYGQDGSYDYACRPGKEGKLTQGGCWTRN